jgi:DNA-binding MarR family transcriptional regulator
MPDAPFALHGALTRNTGFLISRMGLMARRAFAEQIAEVGLTPRGWGALNVLDQEGEVTQQWLGACIGMDPSSMVSTIDELEAHGLVERRRNPQDRRAHALHITDQGRRTLTEGRKVAHRAQEKLLAPLSEDERRQLHELLLRVAHGSTEAGAPPSTQAGASASPQAGTTTGPQAGTTTSSERAAAG